MSKLKYFRTSPASVKQKIYPYCDKCGDNQLFYYGIKPLIKAGTLEYQCRKCGFKKYSNHVSFGVRMQFENTFSIADTHNAGQLLFKDGVSIQKRFYEGESLRTSCLISDVWNRWIEENPIEIIKLAAISEKYVLTANAKSVTKYSNPINYLMQAVQLAKGDYFRILTMKKYKRQTHGRIRHALRYILKNSKDVLWLDGFMKVVPINKTNLIASCTRLHKQFFDSLFLVHGRNPETDFYQPMYITGPEIERCGANQEVLDKKIFEELDKLDKGLQNSLRIIINTGNSGVETSVIRWALKNNRYMIINSIEGFPFGNDKGELDFNHDPEALIKRLLGY